MLSSPIERFISKIIISESGCWEWQSTLNKDGYGQFRVKDKFKLTHRFIYEYCHGEICPDLTIHHTCYNRKCANPAHLTQISLKENILDGNGVAAINARKTHCNRGHPYTKENMVIDVNGYRRCNACRRKSNSATSHHQFLLGGERASMLPSSSLLGQILLTKYF